MVVPKLLIAVGAAAALASCSSSADNPGPATRTTPGAPSAVDTASESSAPPPPALPGRLMFSRFEEATHTFQSMHSINPDGTDEQEIPMPGPEGGGRWSRAGTEIAVLTELPDGRVGTAVISATGEVKRELVPPPGLNLVCVVWSPNDKRLACEGWDDDDPSRTGIYTVDAKDGKDVQRLTETPPGKADFAGDFSPDGSVFLFKRTTDEDPAPLMTVPVSGGPPHQLAPLPVEDAGRYSPDGSMIATSAHGQLLVLSGAGKVLHRIAESGASLFGPDWSPDGKWLAYSRGTSGPFADVYISRLDGRDRFQVTDTPDNEITISWGARA
jgi:TolB protein